MSRDLSCFFPDQVEKRENTFTLVPSKRFKDSEGNPISWEFRFVTKDEFKAIKSVATIRNSAGEFEFSDDRMFEKAIQISCIYPDLKDANLQDMYEAFSDVELLNKMLYPDEVDKLGQKLSMKLGLMDDPKDLLDLAKNL